MQRTPLSARKPKMDGTTIAMPHRVIRIAKRNGEMVWVVREVNILRIRCASLLP